MSKKPVFESKIRRFLIDTRKRNKDYGVRQLAGLVFDKFGIKISKSTVNNIVKSARLSRPVGRSVLKSHRFSGELYGAGYAFFLGAARLLGLNNKLSEIVREMGLCKGIRPESIPSLFDAWLIAKAIYNVPLEKISGYSKKELWDIIGYKISRAHFEEFLMKFEFSQDIANKVFTYITSSVKDVHGIKFTIADGSAFYLDAKSCHLWPDAKIPVNFYTNLLFVNRYINSAIEGKHPFFVLCANPEGAAQKPEVADFITSLDGSVSGKRIRRVDLLGHDGRPISEVPFVLPVRRRYVIGCGPGAWKEVSGHQPLQESSLLFEPLEKLFFVAEERINITQNVGNKEVMARRVYLRSADKTQKTVLLSNLDPKDWNAVEIAEAYLRHFGNFHEYMRQSSGWIKNPGYLDDFVTSGRFLVYALRLKEAVNLDQFFSVLVDICDMFAKMTIFPAACSRWSLLKTRELIYKRPGAVQRDMALDVLFNIFKMKDLEQNRVLEDAHLLFNALSASEISGRKIWISLAGG